MHVIKSATGYLYKRGPHWCLLPNVGGVRNEEQQDDPNLIALIDDLKAKERETGAAIWRDIAKRLEKPRRTNETNLSKLDRYAKEGDVIIVPGKVLAAGKISKTINRGGLQLL